MTARVIKGKGLVKERNEISGHSGTLTFKPHQMCFISQCATSCAAAYSTNNQFLHVYIASTTCLGLFAPVQTFLNKQVLKCESIQCSFSLSNCLYSTHNKAYASIIILLNSDGFFAKQGYTIWLKLNLLAPTTLLKTKAFRTIGLCKT